MGDKDVIATTLNLFVVQSTFSESKYDLGIELFKQADYVEANAYLENLKLEFKYDPEFQYYYGLSLLKTNEIKKAINVLDRAIVLEPDNANFYFALARCYETRMRDVSFVRP